MKNIRQKKILEIIEAEDIDTQETLISKLEEYGFSVTQTTISRDIRDLNLIKTTSPSGRYKYVAPGAKKVGEKRVANSAIASTILHLETAENILVIKTMPGMANAVALFVDTLEDKRILGSVAGDDTLFAVIKDSKTAIEIEQTIRSLLGI